MNNPLLISLNEKCKVGQRAKMNAAVLGDSNTAHYWIGYLEALYEIEQEVRNTPDPPEVDDGLS